VLTGDDADNDDGEEEGWKYDKSNDNKYGRRENKVVESNDRALDAAPSLISRNGARVRRDRRTHGKEKGGRGKEVSDPRTIKIKHKARRLEPALWRVPD